MARDDEETGRTGSASQGGNVASSTSPSGPATRSERGFAAMNPEEQRRIAAKGGKASSESQQRDRQGQFAGRRRAENASGGEPKSEGGSSMESGRTSE